MRQAGLDQLEGTLFRSTSDEVERVTVDSRASSASHRFRTDAKAVRAPTGSLSAFSHSLVQLICPAAMSSWPWCSFSHLSFFADLASSTACVKSKHCSKDDQHPHRLPCC